MRNYRVWEANRKVFLYPENYIRPELRIAKTPAFAALESDLRAAQALSLLLVAVAFALLVFLRGRERGRA